jgi:hypothetical protein
VAGFGSAGIKLSLSATRDLAYLFEFELCGHAS